MMADKLLTRLLSASTALSLLTPPAQAGSSGPKALPHQPFLVAQALPGEPPARSRPDAGGSTVRGSPGGEEDAERPRRERGVAQPGQQPGERQPTRGERRPASPGAPRGGQGASGPEKPDATQPRRAGGSRRYRGAAAAPRESWR